jgi:hypothetical protein
MRDLQTMALSRSSLDDVIEKEELYQRERALLPMEDVIEKMQRDVTIEFLSAPGVYAIRFVYEDAAKAQRATRALLEKMRVPGLVVIQPPVLPARSEHPTRIEITAMGWFSGVLLALLAAGLRRSCRMRMAVAAAVVGALVAVAISLALPREYVSTGRIAVSSAPPLDRAAASHYFASVSRRALGDASLTGMANSPSLSIAKDASKAMPQIIEEFRKKIHIVPVNSDEFSLTVTYHDASKAQAIARELIATLFEEEDRLRRETTVKAQQPASKSAIDSDAVPAVHGQLRMNIEGMDAHLSKGLLRPYAFGPRADGPAARIPDGTVPITQPEALALEGGRKLQLTVPPGMPDAPTSPNRVMVVLVGLIAGLCFGVMTPLPGRHTPGGKAGDRLKA